MSASSGEEENYWPGYVDALTTMTMVLTFILMVLGIVIFILSQELSKKGLVAVAQAIGMDASKLQQSSSENLTAAIMAKLEQVVPKPPPGLPAPEAQSGGERQGPSPAQSQAPQLGQSQTQHADGRAYTPADSGTRTDRESAQANAPGMAQRRQAPGIAVTPADPGQRRGQSLVQAQSSMEGSALLQGGDGIAQMEQDEGLQAGEAQAKAMGMAQVNEASGKATSQLGSGARVGQTDAQAKSSMQGQALLQQTDGQAETPGELGTKVANAPAVAQAADLGHVRESDKRSGASQVRSEKGQGRGSTEAESQPTGDQAAVLDQQHSALNNGEKTSSDTGQNVGERAKAGAGVQAAEAYTIEFPSRGIKLDEKALSSLKAFLSQMEPTATFDLRAFAMGTAASVTEERRNAYYRAMAVRSELVAQGITADRIKLKVVDSTEQADTNLLKIFVPDTRR